MTSVLALLALLATPTSLQTPQIRTLMSVSILRCTFPWVAQVDWKNDEPGPVVKKQDFGFEIMEINLARNTARIVGQAASTELTINKGVDVINFLERTLFGVWNVTSVFASQDKTGRFKAVHSRHLSGGAIDPFPSQNYGYCVGG